MNLSLSKYKTLFLLKAFIIICFFTCSLSCLAQEDTVRFGRVSDIDTTIVSSEDIIDTVVVPDEEDETDTDNDESEKKVFFSEKNPFGGPDSFVLRKLNDSAVSLMKSEKSFWYADKAFRAKKNEGDYAVPFWQGAGFQNFMWIVIILAFVAFLFLYLKEGNVSIFRKTKEISQDEEEGSDGNIFIINYQKEIDKATAAEDYRLAIRLMYLRLLKTLSEKGVIQYKQDKTNLDYLIEASPKKWYNAFFTITRHYEYTWYGQFEVDRDKFEVIHREFINFEKQV